jgi:hypothetical protein
MSNPTTLKPGDKVRVKSLDQEWLVSQEAYLIIQQIGDFSAHGIALGARCIWKNGRGAFREKVYALNDLSPA